MISKFEYETKEEVQNKINELDKKVLLIFGSEVCPPCRQLKRFLDSWKTEKDLNIIDLKKPKFRDMDFFKDKYGLTAFPTCVVTDKTFEKFDMMVGFKGEENIINFVNKNFN